MGRSRNSDTTEPKLDPYYAVPATVPADLVPIGEELSRIEESARWSSQNQFEQGKSWRRLNAWLGVPASVLGVASGGAAITETLPAIVVGSAALGAAALTGVMTVLGAERRATRAQTCANLFQDIQSDARQMLLIDLAVMDRDTARDELRALRARYSEVKETADAPSKRSYRKAGENIRGGGQTFGVDTPPSAT